jgi:hypothetical protein
LVTPRAVDLTRVRRLPKPRGIRRDPLRHLHRRRRSGGESPWRSRWLTPASTFTCWESGDLEYDDATQALYGGESAGMKTRVRSRAESAISVVPPAAGRVGARRCATSISASDPGWPTAVGQSAGMTSTLTTTAPGQCAKCNPPARRPLRPA